jgi:hypothetical protein
MRRGFVLREPGAEKDVEWGVRGRHPEGRWTALRPGEEASTPHPIASTGGRGRGVVTGRDDFRHEVLLPEDCIRREVVTRVKPAGRH